MHAYVHNSQCKADSAVCLVLRDIFARQPQALRARPGRLSFVPGVALAPERRLAGRAMPLISGARVADA